MEGFILVGRIALAAVMAVAGIAKLADLSGSRRAMLGFGVPEVLAPALGLILPIAEIIVAILLLFATSAWWAALSALGLLTVFMAGISINLARGHQPECHCFGQLHSEPIGWPTLVRNGALALLAVWLLWQGPEQLAASRVNLLEGASPLTWIALVVAVVALAVAAFEGWFLLNLLHQNGRLLLRVEALEANANVAAPALPTGANAPGLAAASLAPAFEIPDLRGQLVPLRSLLAAQKPLILLFLDPHCGPCNTLLPEIAAWQHDHVATINIIPITRANADATRLTEAGVRNVLLQTEFEVAQSFGVKSTPSAVVVRADGRISGSVTAGVDAIRSLVATLATSQAAPAIPLPKTATNAHANGDCNCGKNGANGSATPASVLSAAKRGDLVPSFALPDLNGTMRDQTSLNGDSTMLLFWNPGCGFCRRMLDDLKAMETDRGTGAPKLLLISTGTVETNEAMGLQSPILLDTDFGVSRLFGVRGTPSAVLVDTDGRIASEVAAGREAVVALDMAARTPTPNGAHK